MSSLRFATTLFFVDMENAFQTDGRAILVLGHATAGDLQEAINRSPENRLDERRVISVQR